MNLVSNRATRLWTEAFILVFTGLYSHAVVGDTLSITVPKGELEVYEPVVIDVTLTIDPPMRPVTRDSALANREARRLRPRLYAELWRDGACVAEALLGGGAFEPGQIAEDRVVATLLAVFGEKSNAVPSREFVLFGQDRQFSLRVSDRDNGLESNAVLITYTPSRVSDAAEIFASCGVDTLALLLLDKHGDASIPSFRDLASRFPDTVYAHYARAAIALRTVTQETRAAWGNSPTSRLGEMAGELRSAADSLEAGNPLRNRILLEISRLPASASNASPADARRELLSESRDSGYRSLAKQLVKETE
jgi:hypothetical protein